jgi:hypothetical protein
VDAQRGLDERDGRKVVVAVYSAVPLDRQVNAEAPRGSTASLSDGTA